MLTHRFALAIIGPEFEILSSKYFGLLGRWGLLFWLRRFVLMIEPAGQVRFTVSVEGLAGQLSAIDRLLAIRANGVDIPMFPHWSYRPGGSVLVARLYHAEADYHSL